MDVKEATQKARDCITEVFASEEISRLGFQEAVYDPATKRWRVTLGFVPLWDGQSASDVSLGLRPLCIYRVVIDDRDGKTVALTNQLLLASAVCCKPKICSGSACCVGADIEEKIGKTTRKDGGIGVVFWESSPVMRL